MRGSEMLSPDEFDAWAARLNLSDAARAFLERIRRAPPARSVSNGAGNMCGRFASQKMGHTVQWESVTGERPLVLLWEYDSDTYEMWDQSWTLKIRYPLANGKKSGARTVIDFVVLKRDWVGGIDYKTAAELTHLAVEQPYRWVQTGATTWDQPPARAAFKELGLEYRVLSDHDIPHVLVRNIEFLRPRLMRTVSSDSEVVKALQLRLEIERRIVLTDAIAIVSDPDIVYDGHFKRSWFIDLRKDALALPDCVWVYRDQANAQLFDGLERSKIPLLVRAPDPDAIEEGSNIVWAGRSYLLVTRTPAKVFLLTAGQPLLELAGPDFRRLVRSGDMSPTSASPIANPAGLEILRCATNDSINEAVGKFRVLQSVEKGTKVADCGVPRRTFYEWKSDFHQAETQLGNGFLGLISRHDLKGNRSPRTEEAEVVLLKKAFEWLRQEVPRETGAGYAYYVALCETEKIQSRSLTSFNSAWNKEASYEKTRDREGNRAAYPHKPPRATSGAHVAQGPVEGDSLLSRVHIDHLQSDTFCRRLNLVQLLGKPWFTIAIDAYTRWVLGLWVSILSPSHMSLMMVLRDIVRRHGRLPMLTITDGGADMKCKRVAQFLASHGCEHALRPASEPRFGNPVERLNLDINHHLTKVWHGSNEVLKTPRMSSESHDPRALAYRTVSMAAAALEKLLFDQYLDKPHAGLQCTIRQKLDSATAMQGTSYGVPTLFDEQLIFQTLAEPHKHGGLMRQRDGIRLNDWNYYADEMVGRDHEKLNQAPLYDPENPTYIEARIGGSWTRCNMIDSQLRRLPPADHRRYCVSEQIYLARPSTSKDEQLAFLASMGRMYMEQDAERQAVLNGTQANLPQPNSAPPSPCAAPPSSASGDDDADNGTAPNAPPKLTAAPISRRA